MFASAAATSSCRNGCPAPPSPCRFPIIANWIAAPCVPSSGSRSLTASCLRRTEAVHVTALQNRHAALLLQRARGNPAARTRAGTEPRPVESVRRQAEDGPWRIALRLRVPRGARGNRAGTAPVGFASGRTHQRTRLSRPDALADVFVRGEGEIKILAAGSCGRTL